MQNMINFSVLLTINIIATNTLKITAAKIYQGCHLKTVVQPMEVVAV